MKFDLTKSEIQLIVAALRHLRDENDPEIDKLLDQYSRTTDGLMLGNLIEIFERAI